MKQIYYIHNALWLVDVCTWLRINKLAMRKPWQSWRVVGLVLRLLCRLGLVVLWLWLWLWRMMDRRSKLFSSPCLYNSHPIFFWMNWRMVHPQLYLVDCSMLSRSFDWRNTCECLIGTAVWTTSAGVLEEHTQTELAQKTDVSRSC